MDHLLVAPTILKQTRYVVLIEVGQAKKLNNEQNVIEWDRHTIVGVSQEIFKDYLRLTTVSTLSLSCPNH